MSKKQATLNEVLSFYQECHENPEYHRVLALTPKEFKNQAKLNPRRLVLSADPYTGLMSGAGIGGTNATDFIRITFPDVHAVPYSGRAIVNNQVSVEEITEFFEDTDPLSGCLRIKLSFKGTLDAEGRLNRFDAGARGSNGNWLVGFNSPLIAIDAGVVNAGFFTVAEVNTMWNNAMRRALMISELRTTQIMKGGNKAGLELMNELSLVPKNLEAEFQFVPTMTQVPLGTDANGNPLSDAERWTPAITDVAWSNFGLYSVPASELQTICKNEVSAKPLANADFLDAEYNIPKPAASANLSTLG